MRVQFVKTPPPAVVRGEWLAVEIRIVNESNGMVKSMSKVRLIHTICYYAVSSTRPHFRYPYMYHLLVKPAAALRATACWMQQQSHLRFLQKVRVSLLQ